MAKSILDDRLIDLPLSPLMWHIIFGKKLNIFNLKCLGPKIYEPLIDFQRMAN
jgi:hypothetical protein